MTDYIIVLILSIPFAAYLGIWDGARHERQRVAEMLRERSAGLTLQARIELKTIADELEGKKS